MNALADAAYYTDVYKGAEVYDDLDVLLDRASDTVRQHTIYRLDDISKLPEFMQENIKKAVCAQVEYINANGGLDWLNSNGAATVSIGKFSMSGGSSGGASAANNMASPTMLAYLEAVGLLYRGGGAL